MLPRSKNIILLFFFLTITAFGNPQSENVVTNSQNAAIISRALESIYKWDFDQGVAEITQLEQEIGEHPAVYLLKALNLYWQNVPLSHGQPETKEYMKLLTKTVELSDQQLEKNSSDTEGIFFKMLAKSMKMRQFSSDNATFKAIGEAKDVYTLLRIGVDKKEEFNEFYFTTGIYNYYREAYPETYPVYKPVAMFLPSGDKEEGIKQLYYAKDNAMFTSAEARRYLISIYTNYENQLDKAIELSSENVKQYPNNLFFITSHLFILLRSNQIENGLPLMDKLFQSEDTFYQAVAYAMHGYYDWKKGNQETGQEQLLKAEELIQNHKDRNDYVASFIYSELYRCYKSQNNLSLAKNYERKTNDELFGKENIERVNKEENW
ncbi:hypothetical protein V6R21_29145 [Limibacter armeniacum]|uniref:hypothetical protein n=1 Tax=Limibacter armeniacum TaxID=466084 RepID=UPI002FE6917D